MKKKILNIEGMTCSACSNGLEKYLNKQEGIIEAVVNLVMATASIQYDEKILGEKDLNRFVKEAGFKSLGEKSKDGNSKHELKIVVFFSISIITLMYITMIKMWNNTIIDFTMILLSVLAIIWGYDIVKNGVKNIIHKMPNMDSLVGIGVMVTFLYSIYNILNGKEVYFESVIMIILFIKIGRYIDKKNKAKAVDAIKGLVTITPKKAVILKNGIEKTVTINEIEKDDIIICRPGEKIAVDGVIVKGTTHTDESFLTGESKPVSKKEGSNVMAGSINYDGYIEYKAVNIGKDSNISHIVDLVVEATNTKAPIARMADIISGYFVPIIFIISICSFILNIVITKNFSQAITSLVSVLVVACPCALGLATPLAMVVSIGNASKKGILIKSSESIEAINKIDTVIFDKTGTLTKGELEITDEKYIRLEDKEQILKLLISLEKKSNHPIAKSICRDSKDLFEVNEFEEIAGQGIKGKISGKTYFAGNRKYVENNEIKNIFEKEEEKFTQKGKTIVYFWDENEMLGIIGLSDKIKNDSKSTIEKLKRLGKRVIMLSGDNSKTAEIIANELQIDEVYGNILPEGKVEKIKELNNNKNVLMVGDGVNDSPALRTATIGVSVSNGTDISSDSSDIVMLTSDMEKIIDIFNIGKKTMKIIKENLFWALFYNLCMIPLATGLMPISLNPMIAAFAMTMSSLTVVINSLRLRN